MSSKQILLFISLIFLVSVYAGVCFCAFPFADDFCFGWTASESISLWQKFLNQYLNWNGRYTSDLLVQFHPLLTGEIAVYRISLFAGVIFLPLCIYFFLKQLLGDVVQSILISLFITAFYFTYMPDITEELYWFIGSINYQWAHLVLLTHLAFLLKSFLATSYRKHLFAFFSMALLAITIGFNEVAATLLLCFYMMLLLWSAFVKSEHTKLLAMHALITVTCFGFVFASPGNSIRAENFPNKHQLIYSVGYSLLQTFRFVGLWMLTVPFWVSTVIVILHSNKVKLLFNLNLDYRLAGIAALLVVFLGAFLPYYATGLLGQHRTINFVFLLFILLYLLFLVGLSKKFLLYKKWGNFVNGKKRLLLIAASVVSMFFSGNGIRVITDFGSGAFTAYEIAFMERQTTILQNKEAIISPLKELPETFKITDVKGDRNYWTDKCMYNFYLETGIEIK